MNFSKFYKIVSLVLVVCMTALAGVYMANFVLSRNGELIDVGTEEVKGNRINMLLLATDKGGLLTDTIMFASFDKDRDVLNIMSIPRDTRVRLGSSYVKLNSVYGAGEEGKRQEIVISKITELTGMPINYYAVVDPEGFVNIIDILGGVEIDVPVRMYYHDPTQNLLIDLQPGLQVLDGAKSEQFCRFRSGYASADLGRIEAQQMFVHALMEQKLKPKYLLKANAIFEEVSENLITNVGVMDMIKLLPVVKALSGDSVFTYTLPGAPKMIGDASYYVCDRAATDKLINEQFLNIIEE